MIHKNLNFYLIPKTLKYKIVTRETSEMLPFIHKLIRKLKKIDVRNIVPMTGWKQNEFN